MAITQRGAVLVATNTAAFDYFGAGVAASLDGSILAVGASSRKNGSGVAAGTVSIFDKSGASWALRGSEIAAADGMSGDGFGYSVSLSADGAILAVGAPFADPGVISSAGSIYIYIWNGAAWVQRGARIDNPDLKASDYFGNSVSLSADGKILAVGAPGWEASTLYSQGCVHIYDWNGSAWVYRGRLTMQSPAQGDNLGQGISLSGNGQTIAMAARGVAWVYDWSGAAWVQRGGSIAPPAVQYETYLKTAVLSNDGLVLAVGRMSNGTQQGVPGTVYLFDWNGSAWVERSYSIAPSDGAENDFFGASVALAANSKVIIVGASWWEDTTLTNQGGVYTFDDGSWVAFWTHYFGEYEAP